MSIERLRPAAIRAFRNSIALFLVALAIIPFRLLMNGIFDHIWRVNWSEILVVSGILTAILFCFWFFSQLLEFAMAGRRVRVKHMVFPAAMWLRGLYLFSILMGIGLPLGMYHEGDRGWVLYAPILFVLLGYFSWPRAIRFEDGYIQTRHAFFRVTRIPYAEISRITVDRSRGEVAVLGNNGERIVHTNMHVDGARLVKYLRKLTGKSATTLGE
jgi:hypothetical protein